MRALVGVLLVLLGACGTEHLPPPATPAMVMPPIDLGGAPAPGRGRLILDVVDGPAAVHEIQGGSVAAAGGGEAYSASFALARPLCQTPCVVDLPPGPHQLNFALLGDDERVGLGSVNVDASLTAYRYALGRQESKAWKGLLGVPLLAIGAIIDIALLASLGQAGDGPDAGPLIAGGALGVGLTVLGVVLVADSTSIDQPGSGVQWHPVPAAPPAPPAPPASPALPPPALSAPPAATPSAPPPAP